MIVRIAILIVLNLYLWSFSLRDPLLEMHFLDVGQGDSVLIITEDNKKILVDSGKDNTVLSRLSEILPVWDRTIDLMIVTHNDLDHIGGSYFVGENYTIDKVSYSFLDSDLEGVDTRNLQKLDKHYPVDEPNIRVGCCTYLRFLWPREDVSSLFDKNDASLTFELVYKHFNAFFGGDISYEIEEQIGKSDPFVDVDLLKVSHHGSKSSTSKKFLGLVKPEVAVISAGKDNSYGHPHREVLDNLESQDIEVLRTDLSGTVSIYSDGLDYWY